MTFTLNSYLIIIGLTVFTQQTLQHFIPPPSPCLLAQFCNHTGIPICGKQQEEKRKFIDDCDMYEFNCDYHKEFKKVPDGDCEILHETSSTSSTQDTTMMTSQSLTRISSALITERTSGTIPSSTESITPTTILNTTESISISTESTTLTTIPTTTELRSSATESITPTTIPSTTERLSSSIESTTLTSIHSTREPMSSSTESTTPTTIPSTIESTTSSRPESTTVQSNSEAISATSITESTQGDMQVTANYTCTSGVTTIATEISSVVTSTIPASIKTETSSDQPKTNSTCNMYPKHCERPVTWETTSKGETRDFYQILRAKYGDRVKLLRATTHWPTPGVIYRFNEENFRFGRHNES